MPGPRILYVTDLGYEAKGRRYCDEDILFSSRLRADFTVALCHPADAAGLMGDFDGVVVRNSGPVIHYRKQYDAFRERAAADGVRVYNPLNGRGDMAGKQYLVELSAAGLPVIPTVDRAEDLGRLPDADEYVVKLKDGADSIGMRFVPRDGLADLADSEALRSGGPGTSSYSRASPSCTRSPSTSSTTTSSTRSTRPTRTGAGGSYRTK